MPQGLKTTSKALKATGIDAAIRTSSAHWYAARWYERSFLAVRPLPDSISRRSISSTWSGVMGAPANSPGFKVERVTVLFNADAVPLRVSPIQI